MFQHRFALKKRLLRQFLVGDILHRAKLRDKSAPAVELGLADFANMADFTVGPNDSVGKVEIGMPGIRRYIGFENSLPVVGMDLLIASFAGWIQFDMRQTNNSGVLFRPVRQAVCYS